MNIIIIYFLAIGVLAPAAPGVMKDVKDLRDKHNWVGAGAPEDLCLLGVQNRHKDLIGEKVNFLDLEENKLRTLYVVDVAANDHAGIHESKGLIGDINNDCPYGGNFGILFTYGFINKKPKNKFNYSYALSGAHIEELKMPTWLGRTLENSDICGKNLTKCPVWRQTLTLRNIHEIILPKNFEE